MMMSGLTALAAAYDLRPARLEPVPPHGRAHHHALLRAHIIAGADGIHAGFSVLDGAKNLPLHELVQQPLGKGFVKAEIHEQLLHGANIPGHLKDVANAASDPVALFMPGGNFVLEVLPAVGGREIGKGPVVQLRGVPQVRHRVDVLGKVKERAWLFRQTPFVAGGARRQVGGEIPREIGGLVRRAETRRRASPGQTLRRCRCGRCAPRAAAAEMA